MKRIGIFDPAFKPRGHFISFNAYVARLLADPDSEIVFFDLHGHMAEAYAHLALTSPVRFVPLEVPTGNAITRLRTWKRVFERIDAERLDLLCITAEARDGLMYARHPRVPYALFLLYPQGYTASRSFKARIFSWMLRRFVRHARIRLSTSEPPILEEVKRAVKSTDIQWIPNLPIEQQSKEKENIRYDFLTLGTISKSKNHLFAVNAFVKHSLPFSYHIAGAAMDTVGERVTETVRALEERGGIPVSGEFGYLDELTYLQRLAETRFALFPYDFTRGDISSQVLHDCFSTRTPIVAPAIEPFSWYVKSYGIGLTYIEGDDDSFAAALSKALATPRDHFENGFDRLANDHSLDAIRARIRPLIENITPR